MLSRSCCPPGRPTLAEWRTLYLQVRLLKRELALQQSAAELRQAAVLQARAAELQPSGRPILRLAAAARRRAVRAGESRLFARRPRHRRQPTSRRQLSRTAPLLRRPAHRVLVRRLPAAAARLDRRFRSTSRATRAVTSTSTRSAWTAPACASSRAGATTT